MSYENVDLKNATIVDVREISECEMGMVAGSSNIPLGEVPNKIAEFKAMKKPLVLCCRSGARSGQAVEFLSANGVEDIYNGGGWEAVAIKMGS
jgi:rhodanese-related sulfurtransferase